MANSALSYHQQETLDFTGNRAEPFYLFMDFVCGFIYTMSSEKNVGHQLVCVCVCPCVCACIGLGILGALLTYCKVNN